MSAHRFMSIIQLTQVEADSLFHMAKKRANETKYLFPNPGKCIQIHLRSLDLRHEFILSLRAGKIELKKKTFQLRIADVFILARIDLAGGLHRNPDGKEIPCPHIHLYKEGFNDQWAYPLPDVFFNPANWQQTLDEFYEYCNIIEKPYIEFDPYENER